MLRLLKAVRQRRLTLAPSLWVDRNCKGLHPEASSIFRPKRKSSLLYHALSRPGTHTHTQAIQEYALRSVHYKHESLLICHMFYFLLPAPWIFPLASKERGDSASPKFIVTLDGVPSPLGNLADCDMEMDDVRPPTKVTDAPTHINRAPKVSVLHRLQGRVASSEGAGSRPNTPAL